MDWHKLKSEFLLLNCCISTRTPAATFIKPKSNRLVCCVLCKCLWIRFFEDGWITASVMSYRCCDKLENVLRKKFQEYWREDDLQDYRIKERFIKSSPMRRQRSFVFFSMQEGFCGEKGPKCGNLVIGFSTTTMLHPIQSSRWPPSCQETSWLSCPTHLIRQILLPVASFIYPRMKRNLMNLHEGRGTSRESVSLKWRRWRGKRRRRQSRWV